MDILEFNRRINTIKSDKPFLFQLISEKTVDECIISTNEEYYGVSFPECYKEVLKTIGGGYIGYLLLYSMDSNGKHYIRNYISKDMINNMKMLPVIDLETGDYVGFDIINNECTDVVVFWSHDNMDKKEIRMTFYDLIIKVALENKTYLLM